MNEAPEERWSGKGYQLSAISGQPEKSGASVLAES